MADECSRREMIQRIGGMGVGMFAAGLGGCSVIPERKPVGWPMSPMDQVRVGFIGLGSRGFSLLKQILKIEAVAVKAVCDVQADKVQRAQDRVEKAGQAIPAGYSRGGDDYRRLCDRQDLDLVIIATPWEWHTPMAVAAMKAGKCAATEVPATISLDECWRLVEVSEGTGRHCMMMENCCYFRNVMMILNMVRQGIFGELVHCEAGYQHDCRYLSYDSGSGQLSWRGKEALNHNGNMYPTHPLGPVAQWMNINRGDRFDYLVSMSSKAVGLKTFLQDRLGPDHPLVHKPFRQGDVNTTLIRTVNGQTITLYYDTQLPRPYDLIYRVEGTRGIYMGTLNKIMLDDGSGQLKHAWEEIAPYAEKYDHPLWRSLESKAQKGGHGGADFVMLHRLIDCLKRGEQPDMDVYDAACWSSVVPLSEKSVARRSRAVDFPDFTRGKWKLRKPLGIVKGS